MEQPNSWRFRQIVSGMNAADLPCLARFHHLLLSPVPLSEKVAKMSERLQKEQPVRAVVTGICQAHRQPAEARLNGCLLTNL